MALIFSTEKQRLGNLSRPYHIQKGYLAQNIGWGGSNSNCFLFCLKYEAAKRMSACLASNPQRRGIHLLFYPVSVFVFIVLFIFIFIFIFIFHFHFHRQFSNVTLLLSSFPLSSFFLFLLSQRSQAKQKQRRLIRRQSKHKMEEK